MVGAWQGAGREIPKSKVFDRYRTPSRFVVIIPITGRLSCHLLAHVLIFAMRIVSHCCWMILRRLFIFPRKIYVYHFGVNFSRFLNK